MGLMQGGKLRQAGEAELGTGPGARAWGGCETLAGMAAPQSSAGSKKPPPKAAFLAQEKRKAPRWGLWVSQVLPKHREREKNPKIRVIKQQDEGWHALLL